jgi:hypothetical protein
MADGDGLRKADAQLRYYLHIAHPEELSDEEWAMRVKELEWLREEEAKANGSKI